MKRRIEVANVAEREIMKYRSDIPLWLKHCTGQDADPHQMIAIQEIDENPNTIHVWPPRFGKTWSMEAVDMHNLFCNVKESLLIVAPKQEQANNALKEHLDWIEQSPLLNAYIAYRRGKKQLSDTKYELLNGSRAKTLGIHSQIDSEEASIIRGEEYDDIDQERWTDRVISRGGRKNPSGLATRYRLSGTIQRGRGNIYDALQNGMYHQITPFNIYHGLEFGIYDENAIKMAKAKYTDEQWLRIYMLRFVEAKNFIWESYLHECIAYGLKLNWEGVEYKPGGQYKPRGVVYAGFDCGHSGGKKHSSVYRMDIGEFIGNTGMWLNAFEWDPAEDPGKIARDIVDIWRYYDISAAYGDALKANDIALINDMLFDERLVNFDRSDCAANTPANWLKWQFSPQWNTGKFKYLAASELKKKIEHCKFVIPYFSSKDDRPIAKMTRRLVACLLNIREVQSKGQYPVLEIIKKDLGDDPFDAASMMMACANDRQIFSPDISNVVTSDKSIQTSGLHESITREVLEDISGNFDDFM